MNPLIRLAPSAATIIDVDIIDGRDDEHDPPEFALIREHYDIAKKTIRIPDASADRDALWSCLTDLANGYDERAFKDTTSVEEHKVFRLGSLSLATAARKILRFA